MFSGTKGKIIYQSLVNGVVGIDTAAVKNFQVVQMTQQYQTYISEERKTICVTKQHLVLKNMDCY